MGACAQPRTHEPRRQTLNNRLRQPWDEYSHLWTDLWTAVDDTPVACGQTTPLRWTPDERRTPIHRPDYLSPVRAHPPSTRETHDDLQCDPSSPGFTKAKTMTRLLSLGNPHTSEEHGTTSPGRHSDNTLRTCCRRYQRSAHSRSVRSDLCVDVAPAPHAEDQASLLVAVRGPTAQPTRHDGPRGGA